LKPQQEWVGLSIGIQKMPSFHFFLELVATIATVKSQVDSLLKLEAYFKNVTTMRGTKKQQI
jgi:hypothetical protein